jgi:hypothetical protein
MFVLFSYGSYLEIVARACGLLALGAGLGYLAARLLGLQWTRADAIIDAIVGIISCVGGLFLAVASQLPHWHATQPSTADLVRRLEAISLAALVLGVGFRHLLRFVMRQRRSPG